MSENSNWHRLKDHINVELPRPDEVKARQIWWCMVGLNVGHEINGKEANFCRPVLIYKMYNSEVFFGIPLTSKIKTGRSFCHYLGLVNRRPSTALLDQGRTFDTARLLRKMDTLSSSEFERLKLHFGCYFGFPV